jgi:hypothetical protein
MKFQKIYGGIREQEVLSVANVELYVSAGNPDATTGNNQPQMPDKEV